MKILRDLWKNKFVFKGTATTKEFFLSILVNLAAMIVLFPVPMLCYLVLLMLGIRGDMGQAAVIVVTAVYMGVFLLPIPALTVRRMRASGHPMWYQLLMILGIPLYGLILVGVMKPNTRKHCFISKLAYVLLLGSVGGFLWMSLLFGATSLLETFGMGLLAVMTAGIILGGIGAKIDDIRSNAESAGGTDR